MQHLSFCDWLISLRVMALGFIHVVVYDNFLFFSLRLKNMQLNAYATFSLSIGLLMGVSVVSTSDYCEQCCDECGHGDISSRY